MRRGVLFLFAAQAAVAQQSALDPAGPYAHRIETLGAFFLVLLGLIFVIVLVLALVPLARRHRGFQQEPLEVRHEPSPGTEQKLARTVGAATIITVLILFGLVIISVSTGRATSDPIKTSANALTVEITGTQWWWSVRYPNTDASRIAVSANEVHIPVGQPIRIRGTSNDVIHSFWIPNLQGKRDLIPSHITTDWIEADHAGRFRGQCAEFCGLQHAHMALWLIAEPADQFEVWLAHQLQPAAAPTDPVRQRGQQVFLNSGCVLCHAIAGTTAAGEVGPDLTHFASRSTIAAGTLPNNKGNLAGWIADPQNIKPGTHMATVPVNAGDMQPLLEYLEGLQ
jgi:cytochrome c oxidase subunit II